MTRIYIDGLRRCAKCDIVTLLVRCVECGRITRNKPRALTAKKRAKLYTVKRY